MSELALTRARTMLLDTFDRYAAGQATATEVRRALERHENAHRWFHAGLKVAS